MIREYGFAAIVAVVGVSAATASTINFQEGNGPTAGYITQGTYIRSNSADSNYNNTSAHQIIVGRGTGGETLTGLLGFDISYLNSLAGAGEQVTINTVKLTLQTATQVGQNGSGGTTKDFTLDVYAYSAFNEAQATYNTPQAGIAGGTDTTPGGTPGALLAQSVAFNPTTTSQTVTISSAALADAAAAAMNGSHMVYFMLMTDDTTHLNGLFTRLVDDESSTTSARPVLIVDYTITTVPEPASLACFGIAGLSILRLRGTRR